MCIDAMLSCNLKDLQAWPEITVSRNNTNAVVRVKFKKVVVKYKTDSTN